MPEILDKIIELGLDIGVSPGVVNCFPNNDEVFKEGFKNGQFESYRGKIQLAGNTFRCAPNESTNDITMYVELAERIRDVNTELICLKEEFKLDIDRNKTLQDKGVVDINNLLSRIEKQDENIKSKIIYNRIVIGLMIIVYITFEFYKIYNFETQEEICEVKQIL